MSLRGTLLVLACSLVTAGTPAASTATSEPDSPRVRVELVSEVAGIAPGQPFWVALYQRISPGWHTYWADPGHSGQPPRAECALPSCFTSGQHARPPPQRIPVG